MPEDKETNVVDGGLRPVPHVVGGYARVKFFDPAEGREKTVLLSRVRETGVFITGIEVDREGDEVSGPDFDERRRVIAKTAIRKQTPMRMDNKYAMLVSDARRDEHDLGGGWTASRAENEGVRGGRVGVFNLWHKSNREEVLTFEKLRTARTWALEHPQEVSAQVL